MYKYDDYKDDKDNDGKQKPITKLQDFDLYHEEQVPFFWGTQERWTLFFPLLIDTLYKKVEVTSMFVDFYLYALWLCLPSC